MRATRKSPPAAPPALTPPDRERCQAEKPNGHTFMTLGGRPGRERCTARPVTIATEVAPDRHGRRGSMSLCADCWAVMIRQLGAFYASFEPVPPEGR
jgi:hypothetical protein